MTKTKETVKVIDCFHTMVTSKGATHVPTKERNKALTVYKKKDGLELVHFGNTYLPITRTEQGEAVLRVPKSYYTGPDPEVNPAVEEHATTTTAAEPATHTAEAQ